jgi:hypothetical protein
MKKELELQSERMNLIFKELENALKHADIAANHFLLAEVPRACAHTIALQGHLAVVSEILAEVAKLHRAKASV